MSQNGETAKKRQEFSGPVDNLLMSHVTIVIVTKVCTVDDEKVIRQIEGQCDYNDELRRCGTGMSE